jgi:hypothetical protein
MHKLKPVSQFTSQFLLTTAPSSHKPIIVPGAFFLGSNGKLIFILQVFTLKAVLEEQIKLINRGITVICLLIKCFAPWIHFLLAISVLSVTLFSLTS